MHGKIYHNMMLRVNCVDIKLADRCQIDDSFHDSPHFLGLKATSIDLSRIERLMSDLYLRGKEYTDKNLPKFFEKFSNLQGLKYASFYDAYEGKFRTYFR